MVGERDGDCSGAGADVEDIERGLVVQFGEDGFDEVFGFGARDKDGGRDAEGEAVELLLAGDVLDGFVGEAAVDGGVVGGLLTGGEEAVGVGEVVGARDSERVEEEDEGVA